MDQVKVLSVVKRHLLKAFESSRIGNNEMSVECLGSGQGWEADTEHWNYVAASKAIKQVWGVEPGNTLLHCFQNKANSLIFRLHTRGWHHSFHEHAGGYFRKEYLINTNGPGR